MRPALGVAAIALARAGILVLAYFASPLAPIALVWSAPITWFDVMPDRLWSWNPGFWLTPGHVILIALWPLGWAARRALGPNRAALAAILGWALPLGALGIAMAALSSMFTVSPVPPLPVAAAFGAAMAASEFLLWRGLSRRGARATDAPLIAAIFSLLFNALTYGLDPGLAGPRLVIQTALHALIAVILVWPLSLIAPRRR